MDRWNKSNVKSIALSKFPAVALGHATHLYSYRTKKLRSEKPAKSQGGWKSSYLTFISCDSSQHGEYFLVKTFSLLPSSHYKLIYKYRIV
jgi:hypothetical protein